MVYWDKQHVAITEPRITCSCPSPTLRLVFAKFLRKQNITPGRADNDTGRVLPRGSSCAKAPIAQIATAPPRPTIIITLLGRFEYMAKRNFEVAQRVIITRQVFFHSHNILVISNNINMYGVFYLIHRQVDVNRSTDTHTHTLTPNTNMLFSCFSHKICMIKSFIFFQNCPKCCNIFCYHSKKLIK